MVTYFHSLFLIPLDKQEPKNEEESCPPGSVYFNNCKRLILVLFFFLSVYYRLADLTDKARYERQRKHPHPLA
jgi:hypothetical protein